MHPPFPWHVIPVYRVEKICPGGGIGVGTVFVGGVCTFFVWRIVWSSRQFVERTFGLVTIVWRLVLVEVMSGAIPIRIRVELFFQGFWWVE